VWRSIGCKRAPTIVDALPLIANGSQAFNSAIGAYERITQTTQDFFEHRETDEYICNGNDYFVSQDWLDNLGNVERIGFMRPPTQSIQPTLRT